MTDRVGQQLGKYILRQRLGKGGFSEVYLGEHIYLETKAAIKVFNIQLTEEDKADFFSEAKIIAGLKHQHIVGVLDFDIENNTPFLVLEYAPNGTLRRRHPKNTQVPLATIIPYVEQVAEALQYAHDEGFIHRDVKPGNMLLNKHNDILLSDFGTAIQVQSSITVKQYEMVGTPAYTAPEQLQGNACFASDQYSLGIVVYEWLTGSRPFRGSLEEVASQQLLTPLPPLHEKVPDIPPAVEQVILKALAKQPKNRFPTIRDFALSLKQASQSAQVEEEPMVSTFPSSPPQTPSLANNPQSISMATVPILDRDGDGTPLPLTLPKPSTSISRVSRHSRRRILTLGLTGLLLAGAGSLVLLSRSQQPLHSAPAVHSTQTTFTLSPPPPNETLYTYVGHTGVVNSVAWSPHSTRIASASADRTVQVWNATDGSFAFTYHGHNAGVRAIAWSPNGQRMASASRDKTIQIWNTSNGSNIFTYHDRSTLLNAVAWSPDGTRIASANNNLVRVWNATTGNIIATYRGHIDKVNSVAWSPDGRHLASAGADHIVRIWDTSTGKRFITYTRHTDAVKAVVWSPNGKFLASASSDGTVQVWDATDGHSIFTYKGHSDAVNALAWSPDGTRIVSGSADQTVQVWDATTGEHVFIYKGHSGHVNTVAWSPHGKLIASGSNDQSVQVWQAK